MWSWLHRLLRLGRRPPVMIGDLLWQQTLDALPFLANLSPADLIRLRKLSAEFLACKQFHGAQGLGINDLMALSVAAQACLPLLHLAPAHRVLDWYDDFVTIVIHPDEVVARRELMDEHGIVHQFDEVLAGEAMAGGPVMLNWHDVAGSGETAEDGFNLVLHEFLHKLDLRDGLADGCPPLPPRFMGARTASQARQCWQSELQTAFEIFREQVVRSERFGQPVPWLDAYGATSIDEFFAVTGEAYFVNRSRFRLEFPKLLTLYDAWFKQAALGPQ